MPEPINQGGPAFPFNAIDRRNSDGAEFVSFQHWGLTKRDYFAAAALTGLLAYSADDAHSYKDLDDATSEFARISFLYADKMIAESEKR